MSTPFTIEVKKAFPKDQYIFEDQSEIDHYSLDWTRNWKPNALGVFFPKSTTETQKIVQICFKHKISIVPSGGRTGLSGGAVASQKELIISFDKMNTIISFSEEDFCVTVQAGVITQKLKQYLIEKSFNFPVDFSAIGTSQIGGNIATNAGGLNVIQYGPTRNWVAGLTVVTGTGEVLNLQSVLRKDNSGYDLKQLFIGSEGTLGLITEANLWVVPNKKTSHKKTILLSISSLNHITTLFSEIRSQFFISGFEFMSKRSLEYSLGMLQKTWPLEEINDSLLIQVELNSDKDSELILELFEKFFKDELVQDGFIAESSSEESNLWTIRESISESIAPHTPYKNDVSVPVSTLPHFLEKIPEFIQSQYQSLSRPIDVVVFGHVGDGNLHINMLKPQETSAHDFYKTCQTISNKLFEWIKTHNGSVSAEHGIGLLKKDALLNIQATEKIKYYKSIKKIFDPKGILNPGKIFD